MKQSLLITNGQIVLPDRILSPGEVLIEDGIIQFAGHQHSHRGRIANRVQDAEGCFVLPGLIDLHSDAIEKELEPRPGAFFAAEVAFTELEKKLAGTGITTMYHSFSFAGAEWGVRNDEAAAASIRKIVAMASQRWLIRNRIHLRFEITDSPGVEIVRSLVDDGMIDLLSFMDHTPGQGQYPTLEDYRRYMEKTYHVPFSAIEANIAAKERGRAKAPGNIALLSAAARRAGVLLASHDDDHPEGLVAYRSHGVTIHEFPVNLATAEAARRLGSLVCVGAPNIVRDGSSGKGMSAMHAIAAGAANIICSDYYPPAILQAVFKLSREHLTLAEAVRMASLEPAWAVGLSLLGSLEEGKVGDAIIVSLRGGVPVVTNTMVAGMQVYGISYCDQVKDGRDPGMPPFINSVPPGSAINGV